MRLGTVAWLLPCLLLACGGRTSDATGQSTGGSGGATTTSDAIVGQVFVTTAIANGNDSYDYFFVEFPFTSHNSGCEGAARTVGSCCYFAPTPPPGSRPPGSGTPATGVSAGTLQLLDGTSHASLGTYDSSNGQYPNLPASFYTGGWKAGDQLTVTASGGEIGAFQVSGPALTPPTEAMPSPANPGQDLTITWAADPNSQAMSIQLLGEGVIWCTAPEAQQSVTIDASLLSAFGLSSCQSAATRTAVRETTVATGRVQFITSGYATSAHCPGW
jgi:hypothetical protein